MTGEDELIVLAEYDNLAVCEMTETAARDIAEWHYPDEYKKYDFEGYEKEEEQLFNGLHFCVYAADEEGCLENLIGFVSVGPAAQAKCSVAAKIYEDESFTDIGIGLRPSLCGLGTGLGLRLVNAAVAFVKSEFPEDGVRLTVAKDNIRAIKVYKRAGFTHTAQFKQKKEAFLVMTKA